MKGFLLNISCLLLLLTINTTSQENFDNNSPLKIGTTYTGDIINNYSGGIKNGSVYLGMANLHISVDSRNAGLWKNGQFFINASNTHGGSPVGILTGDFQGVSNIEAGNLTWLHELWYKHTFSKGIITLGLQDLSSDFAVSEYGALFLNGSFGTHPTIGSNMPVPVFPLTALGVQIQISLNKSLELRTAFYDGFPDDHETNPYNLKWKWNKDEGFLSITELHLRSTFLNNLPGSFKLGAYYHTHTIPGDEGKALCITNNYGFFLTADQIILKYSDNNRIALFIQTGVNPYSGNENHFYMGGGINYFGLFNDNDILGIGAASAALTNRNIRNETTVEFSYLLNITDFFSLQPDLQYIIHPSGTDILLPNTLAANLRMSINLQ